jgi:lysophospholipase L1-like esterase
MSSAKTALLVALTLVIGVVAVEAGLHALVALIPDPDKPQRPRHELSPYASGDWAEEMFREQEDVYRHRVRYDPFLGWALRKYKGRYINMDERGARFTPAPAGVEAATADTIYVFGGSTIWGEGVRDEFTVPSHLTRQLAAGDTLYQVSNLGVPAYQFMQEVMSLTLRLRQGERPRYVIFYDGVNDVYSAYRAGVAGRVSNPWFSRNQSPARKIIRGFREFIREHSMIHRGLSAITTLWGTSRDTKRSVPDDWSDMQLRELAGEIANDYVATYGLLDRLARSYGFEYLTLWQPVTFTEARLLEEERNDPRTQLRALAALHVYTLEALSGKSLENFHDISDALKDRQQMYYIDYHHLSEAGNGAVARRIATVFRTHFPEAQ